MSVLPEAGKEVRQWHAELDLELALRDEVTVVAKARHSGPLRIQKAFPQEDGGCHVYLLHPPGGLVGGDQLTIRVCSQPGTKALITTPSAGKFYRCLEGLEQKQRFQITVNGSAQLEWLPQENIFFDGARSDLETEVHMALDSLFIGWDIHCLGRRAMGESFSTGQMTQRLRLFREGVLLHRERLEVLPGSPSRAAGWGLGGMGVIGTLVAALPVVVAQNASRQIQAEILELNSLEPRQCWGFSQKDSIILGRYLGESAEECRDGLTQMRVNLSAAGVGATPAIPRIWNT